MKRHVGQEAPSSVRLLHPDLETYSQKTEEIDAQSLWIIYLMIYHLNYDLNPLSVPINSCIRNLLTRIKNKLFVN